MFIFLAILSALGFAVQYAFMTKFVRKGDVLSMSAYRSLSLGVSVLPLLLFTTQENIVSVIYYQWELLLSAFASIGSVLLYFYSMKSLPIGITYAIRYLTSALASIMISWFLFHENLSLGTILFIGLGLAGAVYLSIFKVDFHHLENTSFYRGVLGAILSGPLLGLSLMLMSKVSRELDPFVAGYFWELETAMVFILVLGLRKIFTGKSPEKISMIDFGKILLACSPTIIGTGCFALAVLYGPAGIVSALSVVGIVFTTVIGALFFKEHLKPYQYIAIIVIVIAIAGIKLSI